MAPSRKAIVLGAAGLAVGALLAIALATRGGPTPPKVDLSDDLASAFNAAQADKLELNPPRKVSSIVLAAGGVPERNAPSFHPRRIEAVGAAIVRAIDRPAALVLYRGEPEGTLAVLSLQGKLADLSLDAGTIEFQGRRYTTFLRPGPGGAPLHGVGQSQAGRLVFVVGTQPVEKLAELAAMIPQP